MIQLSAVFNQNCTVPESVYNINNLNIWLYSTCKSVSLDTVASLKISQPKTKFEPWQNYMTHYVRCDLHRPERKWKKGKVQVSLQVLWDFC